MKLNERSIESVERCPVCKSSHLRHWRSGRDRKHQLSTSEFVYSRCTSCSVIFLSVRPTEAAIASFYPADYGPYRTAGETASSQTGRAERLDTEKTTLSMRERLAGVLRLGNDAMTRLLGADTSTRLELMRPGRPSAAFLDFGCGSDRLLNRARALGWVTTGMDFNPLIVDVVRRQGHNGACVDEDGWRSLPDETFDLVRMSHVVEHLYHPAETLDRLRVKMRHGGRLEIAVPNPAGLSSRVFRARWYGLDCPRHIVLYRPGVLQRLLETLGFRVESIVHEVITKDLARSLGHLLHDYRLMSHSDIEVLQYHSLLNELLRMPGVVAAKLGLADRFSVVAVKP